MYLFSHSYQPTTQQDLLTNSYQLKNTTNLYQQKYMQTVPQKVYKQDVSKMYPEICIIATEVYIIWSLELCIVFDIDDYQHSYCIVNY